MGQQGPGDLRHGPAEAALQPCTKFNSDAEQHTLCAGAAQAYPDATVGGGPGGVGLESISLRLRLRGVAVAPARVGGRKEGRGDAGVIIEKVPERSKTSGCGRRPGVVRRRILVRIQRGLRATGGG